MTVVTCRWCGQHFATRDDLEWHTRHDHHVTEIDLTRPVPARSGGARRPVAIPAPRSA